MDVSSIMSMQNQQEPLKKKFPVDSKSYRLIKVINQGTNSTVYKAFCVPMNTTVVIKAINLDQSTMNLFNSTAMFPFLRFHPNILNSYCTFAVNRTIWIIMPFLPAVSLKSIISYSFPTGLPENCIAVILKQILNLLSYLHFNEILHRDLKPGNILLDSMGVIKFSDFGLCALISEFSSPRIPTVSGGPYWVAPELTNSSDGYSVKSDIWSFGILALELAQGRPPLSHVFDQYLSLSLTKNINERFFPMKSSRNSCSHKKVFSESFKDLVLQCLEQDPGKRPTLESLYHHGFFKKCKSYTFLGKKIMNELPSLEARFQLSIESDYNVGEEKKEVTSQCRVGGWKLNVESLELYPILYPVPVIDLRETRAHVRFGGEIIIEEKEVITEDDDDDDDDEDTEEDEEEEVSEQFEKVGMELNDVNEWVDEMNEKSSRICEIQTKQAKTNFEEQMRRIKSMIITHGGDGVLPEKEKVSVVPEMQKDDQLFMGVLEKHLKLNSDMAVELERLNSLLSQRRFIKQSK